MSDQPTPPSEFEKAAASQPAGESILVEFWDFLKHNKKWWLLPIVVMMALLGVIIYLGSGAATPFIYTLF